MRGRPAMFGQLPGGRAKGKEHLWAGTGLTASLNLPARDDAPCDG